MKSYQDFNRECPPEEAEMRFDAVAEAFAEADIPAYREFLSMILRWRKEIINSFQRPDGRKQSNALTENINSQIRTY